LCLLAANPVWAGDWAYWRGPEQNGVSHEGDLPEKWSVAGGEGSNLIWTAPFGGRSTPLLMKGRLFMINNAGEGESEQERVLCLDAETGKVIWEYRFNVFHTDIVSVRVGWTNLAADTQTGNIYAHGTGGLLLCLSSDGKRLWSRSMTEEFGRVSGYGGRVTSPVVDGDLVILGMANAAWGQYATGGNRFMAFDKRTGEVVWTTPSVGQPRTYSSTPVVAVINGQRLLITGGSDGGVHALRVRTGEKVWSYHFAAGAINTSPVVEGNFVYAAHGEENTDTNLQGRVVCLDASKVQDGKPALVWQVDDIKVKFASPIIHEGRMYVCDETAEMYCLNAKTGDEIWTFRYGADAKASPVLADGKIYVAEVGAKFHILKPGHDKCTHLHQQRFRHPDGVSEVEINGSAAVANGRIYFSNSFATYCIGKKDHKAATVERPPRAAPEPPPLPEAKVAHLQIVPAEVALRPGESVTFRALGFDNQGRFLKEVPVTWELAASLPTEGLPPPKTEPPVLKGTITPQGKLTVDATLQGQGGGVVAKMGSLTGRARVRVVPALPYKQDFAKVSVGAPMAGWVNCQGKFNVQDKGGSQVLVKLANSSNPLLCQVNTYFGEPGLSNYTIEADVQGTRKGNDLPDFGLVNSRYTLMLMGETQSLRIVSWEAKPRVDRTIPFPWKTDVWYRMKLMVEVKDGKALVRGKVWPRDQKEPEQWTVEYTDATPNLEGSPGLYGYAKGIIGGQTGTEIYYDNVAVTPNKGK
jgi:outer membrane protein assembly factor BamB